MDLETQQRVRAIIKRLQSEVEESYNNFLLTHGHGTEDRGQSVTNYQSTESNICLSTVQEMLFLVSRVRVTRHVSRSITAANTASLVPMFCFLHLVIRKLYREFEFLKVQQPIVVNIKFQQIFLQLCCLCVLGGDNLFNFVLSQIFTIRAMFQQKKPSLPQKNMEVTFPSKPLERP